MGRTPFYASGYAEHEIDPMIAAEWGAGQIAWSLFWIVVFVFWVVVVLVSFVSASRAIWRYVGKSEDGTTRAVFAVLAILALAVTYVFLFGIVIGLVIVFFDRKSSKSQKPPESPMSELPPPTA